MVRDSFSSRGKSNLQLIEKKMRKRGFKVKMKKGKESEKREEVCKNVEKVRRRFWWRWLSFVRGHWSGVDPLRSEVDPKSVAQALRTSDSNATGMDVIEIPIEPGRKISKILIKPTRTGIKAMIAQCRTPSCADKTPPPEDASWDGRTRAPSDTLLSEESTRFRDRSANWTRRTFDNDEEISASKETLLTSALFIREDMDNIVESAVFIEPNLPNDYTDSKKSDELSQKSIKINKRRVSYRIIDETNEEIRKTIKTVSEPTWIEREKILRRQRVHENINNLLEQFMFLESEDVVGLTIPHSRPQQDRKTIYVGGDSSPGTGGHLIKEISREVSPEILVNIKPFKEYLSDDYLRVEGSASRGDERPQQHHRNHRGSYGPGRAPRKSKAGRKKSDKGEEYSYPILNSVLVSEEREYADMLRNYPELGGGVQREMRRTYYGDCEELTSLASLASLGCIEKEDSPMCSIWGVCKTYSACNGSSKEGVTSGGKGVAGSGKESLDELLDTLDDSDHDVVFQKNISQFRKKINVVPRLDLRKPSARVTAKRAQNYLELVKPIIECVVEESEEEERGDGGPQAPGKAKTEALSVCAAEKCQNEGKSYRVFVINFLLLSWRIAVARTLGTRTEDSMVKIVGRFREMYAMVERSRRTVVQRVWGAREVYPMAVTAVGTPESSEELQANSPPLGSQGGDVGLSGPFPKDDIPRPLGLFSSTAECFYVIQRPCYPSPEELNGFDPKELKLLEKTGGRVCGELRGTDEESRGISFVVFSEATSGATRRAIEIVRNVAFDYVTTILGSEDGCPGTLGENHSEHSDCGGSRGAIWVEESRAVGEVEMLGGSGVDGFHILYNNDRESLNDDDDEAVKVESAKSLEEGKQEVVFVVESGSSNEEEEEEEEEEAEAEAGDEGEREKEGEERDGGEKGKGEEVCSGESPRAPRIVEEKLQRFLKWKSNSSPRENIIQNELSCQEHRMRRSLILLKEIERDFQNGKKKRLSGDKSVEMRRTGSALVELHSGKLGQDASFLQKNSSFGGEKAFASLVLPEELKAKPDRNAKSLDGKKMLLGNSGKSNVRKEVIAAFNSIKELGACKGETKGGNKRMSLVIMLSKK